MRMWSIACLLSAVLAFGAAADVDELDYDVAPAVLVEDPALAGDAPFHLLRVAADSTIPIDLSGSLGVRFVDGDATGLFNARVSRRQRLEIGTRLDARDDGSLAAGTVGLRHQIHRYLAWGINATVRDGGSNSDSRRGGTFVFMARQRGLLGTPVGARAKVGTGIGRAIVADGLGVRGSLDLDYDSSMMTLFAGVRGRTMTASGGTSGIDGWLGLTYPLSGIGTMRLSAATGLAGADRQPDLSVTAVLTVAPR